MSNRPVWKIIVPLFLLAIPFIITGCGLIHVISGTITDPTGDSTGTPDLTRASISVSGGNARVFVIFASGTFDQHLTFVSFCLDTDQNIATGSPGINNLGADSALMGTDFIIRMGSDTYGTVGQVLKYTGTWTEVGTALVQYFGNGLSATIPLSLLDNDDGYMNFKATCSTQTSFATFTGIQDYITDVGSPVGMTN